MSESNKADERRRPPTIKDHARRIAGDVGVYGVLLGASVTVFAALGWGNPLVMAKDYTEDKTVLEKRLTQFDDRFKAIETQLGALTTSVLEAKELQLKSELRTIDLELARARAGTSFASLLATQRDQVEQDLRKVQEELQKRRSR